MDARFRGRRVVVVAAQSKHPQKRAHCSFSREEGGGDGGTQQPPSKTRVYAHFRGWWHRGRYLIDGVGSLLLQVLVVIMGDGKSDYLKNERLR